MSRFGLPLAATATAGAALPTTPPTSTSASLAATFLPTSALSTSALPAAALATTAALPTATTLTAAATLTPASSSLAAATTGTTRTTTSAAAFLPAAAPASLTASARPSRPASALAAAALAAALTSTTALLPTATATPRTTLLSSTTATTTLAAATAGSPAFAIGHAMDSLRWPPRSGGLSSGMDSASGGHARLDCLGPGPCGAPKYMRWFRGQRSEIAHIGALVFWRQPQRSGIVSREMTSTETGQRFPPTSHTLVEAITSPERKERVHALELLAAGYWKPVYGYLRLHWHLEPADAEDLTQEFFSHLLDKEPFARFDPRKARFRTFLRVCLDGFAANQRKAAGRLKRGGGARLLSLDFPGAEGELRTHDIADPYDPEVEFRRSWVRNLFTDAVKQLERELKAAGKGRSFRIFEQYDLTGHPAREHPTYADLARKLGLTPTQVNNDLSAARRQFRHILLARIRSLCATEAEFREEARDLFQGESL
jgi:RNA polymerase sigma factor (sigma-70 family)